MCAQCETYMFTLKSKINIIINIFGKLQKGYRVHKIADFVNNFFKTRIR